MRASQFDLGWGRPSNQARDRQSIPGRPTYLYALSWRGLKLNRLWSTASLLDLAVRKSLARSPFLQKLKRVARPASESTGEPLERECFERPEFAPVIRKRLNFLLDHALIPQTTAKLSGSPSFVLERGEPHSNA
jgi:hypothetical protein